MSSAAVLVDPTCAISTIFVKAICSNGNLTVRANSSSSNLSEPLYSVQCWTDE